MLDFSSPAIEMSFNKRVLKSIDGRRKTADVLFHLGTGGCANAFRACRAWRSLREVTSKERARWLREKYFKTADPEEIFNLFKVDQGDRCNLGEFTEAIQIGECTFFLCRSGEGRLVWVGGI